MNYGLLPFTLPTFFDYYAHCEESFPSFTPLGKDDVAISVKSKAYLMGHCHGAKAPLNDS
jgi:hypothetical protein